MKIETWSFKMRFEDDTVEGALTKAFKYGKNKSPSGNKQNNRSSRRNNDASDRIHCARLEGRLRSKTDEIVRRMQTVQRLETDRRSASQAAERRQCAADNSTDHADDLTTFTALPVGGNILSLIRGMDRGQLQPRERQNALTALVPGLEDTIYPDRRMRHYIDQRGAANNRVIEIGRQRNAEIESIEMLREEVWLLGTQLISCQVRGALNNRHFETELSPRSGSKFRQAYGSGKKGNSN